MGVSIYTWRDMGLIVNYENYICGLSMVGTDGFIIVGIILIADFDLELSMAICPYCNATLEVAALKVQSCGEQRYLQNVSMICCPKCERVLRFVQAVSITVAAAAGGGGGGADGGADGGGSASVSVPAGPGTKSIANDNTVAGPPGVQSSLNS